jgi:hypothetical protein
MMLIAAGHRRSGRIVAGVKKRTKAIMPLIAKYNQLITEIPRDASLPPLNPLTINQLKQKTLLDDFWELERRQCHERWAIDPSTRSGIKAWYEYERAKEEISILKLEVERFVEWNIARLDDVERLVPLVDGVIRSRLLNIGTKSMRALSSLGRGRLGGLKLPESFNDVMPAIQGIL